MSEISVERLATELSVERYFAPQPRQGVVGALYVVVLVAGVLLAVALTVLFVRIAMHVPASLPGDRVGIVPGEDRANAEAHAAPGMPTADGTGQGRAGAPAATGAAMDGGGIGDRGAETGSGIGESRLKDFYLKCALKIGRHGMNADGAVACGQIADVMLAQRFGGDVEPTLAASGAQVVQRLAAQQG